MSPLSWQQLAETLAGRVSPVTGVELISLRRAGGRCLSAPVIAAKAIPAFDHAVMDGFAIGGNTPGQYNIISPEQDALSASEALRVSAGMRVPTNTKAVVLAHNTEVSGDVLIVPALSRRDNVRRQGEEAQSGETLLVAGTRLDARHLALAAMAAVTELEVMQQPRVALLGLQDQPQQLPHLAVMAAMLTTPSLNFTLAGAARTQDLPRQLSQLSQNHDLVVVVAESLRGEDGALFQALQERGADAEVWRANLKPAKPVITGKLGACHILGLAGTAYATATAAHLFLRPVLQRLLDLPVQQATTMATTDFARTREGGRAEALPVMARQDNGALKLTPAGRFGQLRALAAMDGMALIEAEQGDIAAGTHVHFMRVQIPLI
ncbi:MAG: hypothetical protein ACRCWF_07000 [Beijerinckiaceae bacterium]